MEKASYKVDTLPRTAIVLDELIRCYAEAKDLPQQEEDADPRLSHAAAKSKRFRYRQKLYGYLLKPLDEVSKDETFKSFLYRYVLTYPAESKNIGLAQLYQTLFKENLLPSEKELEAANQAIKKAETMAQILSKKYDVPVHVVRTNDEYYSDEFIKLSITEGIYFISCEDLITTCKATELLIRFNLLKKTISNKMDSERPQDHIDLLAVANKKKAEKVKKVSSDLGREIESVKQDYKILHNGEEPNLSKVAAILNERQITSPSGKPKKWVAETVKRVLNRYNSLPDK